MELRIANLVAKPGEKVTGTIAVPGTSVKLPVTLINGKNDGKTVLITAGIHNAEYSGIETAIQLAGEIEPDQISGGLMIIHLVNVSGFEKRTMSVVPEDGKNLNRIFPGNPDGTEGDKICHFLVTAFFSQADFYIDLHAGDGYESLTPYVYYLGAATPEVAEQAKAMAQKVDVPYMVQSDIATGGAYNYAGSCGIPSILIERGGEARWSEAEVSLYKADVKNVLRHLTVLEGTVKANENKPVDISDVVYENAAFTGCWYPRKKSGEMFKKGEEVGVIKDYFGKQRQTCIAKYDGVILYQVSSLAILKDGPMIAYGKISN
ncbi:MAG: succinylglutamate desuccinylase/aspartoacylase family protein [Acetobacterium woodii]|nr:succinylglutamate desuccinylase/aspartoacylase family protein [Acetobacterium woodii]